MNNIRFVYTVDDHCGVVGEGPPAMREIANSNSTSGQMFGFLQIFYS